MHAVKGSANRFPPGERQQENGPRSLSRNAVITAVTRAILGPNHDLPLKRVVGTKLDVTALLGPEDTRPRCPRCHPPRRPEAAKVV